jgi:hypothetical protein
MRGYALSHSAEVTHSFIQQAPSLPMMADRDVPRRSDRLTAEEKVNHTKRMRATNELKASLDHPAPASRKKKPKAAWTKKKMDQLARVNFTNAGRGRILKSGEYATGGEFVGGQLVHEDAPVSLIKDIVDKHLEVMINEVRELKLATRSVVANHHDQYLAFARVAASLGGDYDMKPMKAEGGFAETANPILVGGGVLFNVLWVDAVQKKVFEETTQIVTKEYLQSYFHDLYFQLIVCNEEQHKPALHQLLEWNFSYNSPLAFWSVIFHSRGENGLANDNTFTWKEALSHATPDLNWDQMFMKRSWDKKNHKDSSQEEEQLE